MPSRVPADPDPRRAGAGSPPTRTPRRAGSRPTRAPAEPAPGPRRTGPPPSCPAPGSIARSLELACSNGVPDDFGARHGRRPARVGPKRCAIIPEASTRVGLRATQTREPRQIRKEATVSGPFRVPRITWSSSWPFIRVHRRQASRFLLWSFVQNLSSAVLVALSGALVLLGGYQAIERARAAVR